MKKGSFSVLVKIGGYGFIEKKGAVNGARNKKYGGLRKVRTPIIAPPFFEWCDLVSWMNPFYKVWPFL